MEGYDEILAKAGKSEAEYVVFGNYKDRSGENISIVRPLTDLGIAPAYAASTAQSKRVAYYNKEGKANKEKANAEIKAKYKGSAPAPAANKKKDVAPAPAPTPKPKDNTGKVDANKADAIDKANKASGGKMKRFTKK
jgi:hypothetical protein